MLTYPNLFYPNARIIQNEFAGDDIINNYVMQYFKASTWCKNG